MSANSTTLQATTGFSIRQVIARHPIFSFFAILYAGVLLAYMPVLLSQNGFGLLPYSIPFPADLINLPASLLGSTLAGFVVAAATGGKEAVRQLRRRMFKWQVSPKWYVYVLAGIPVLAFLSASDWMGVKTTDFLTHQLLAFIPAYLIQALIIGALVSEWEEGGLTGYATPALQERVGPLATPFIVGPLWALMHIPAFFIPEMGTGSSKSLAAFGISLGFLIVAAVVVRIITTWLFNSTGQSVLLVTLFHGAMNSTQSTLTQMLPGYTSLYLIAGMAVVAVLIIAFTKGRLGYKHQETQAAGDMSFEC